jgi:hypothetical protein
MADIVLYDTVGSQGDAASTTGSLHAKVVELRNYFATLISSLSGSTSKHPRLTGYKETEGSYNGWFNVASVTGSGWLTGIEVTPPANGAATYLFLKVIIDGTILFEGYTNSVIFAQTIINGTNYALSNSGSLSLHHRFNSSFSVSVYPNATGYFSSYVSYTTDN